MNLGPAEVALMIGGAAVGALGLWLFIWKRPKGRSRSDTSIPPLTEPTRLALAAICLITGYHLILWALPPGTAAVQLPRSKWYIWLLVGICLVLLTFALDKIERDRAKKSSTDDSRRP
jgi:hypothetical protein